MVERVLAKHKVVGSKPITRSMKIFNKIKAYLVIRCSPSIEAFVTHISPNLAANVALESLAGRLELDRELGVLAI